MKYLDEYRDPEIARSLVAKIAKRVTRPWVLMEICGGQTHTIMRYGLDELLPSQLELVHGPGCPVCVTPIEMIDKAITLASGPDDCRFLWRHVARAGIPFRPVSRQGCRWRCADCVLADGSGEDRPGQLAAQGGFFRCWI